MSSDSRNISTQNYTPWLGSGASNRVSSPGANLTEKEEGTIVRPEFADSYVPSDEMRSETGYLVGSAAKFNRSVADSTGTVDIYSTANDYSKSQIARRNFAALNYWIENLSDPSVNLRLANYLNERGAVESGSENYRYNVLKDLVRGLASSDDAGKTFTKYDSEGKPIGEMSIAEYAAKVDDGITLDKYINDPVVRNAILKQAKAIKDSSGYTQARVYNREYSSGAAQTGMATVGFLGTIGSTLAGIGLIYGAGAGISTLAGLGSSAAAGAGALAVTAGLLSNPVGWVCLAGILAIGIGAAATVAVTAMNSGKYVLDGRNDLSGNPFELPGYALNNFLMGIEARDAKDFIPQT